MRRRVLGRIILSLGLAPLVTGCGSSSALPPDSAKQAASDAATRLEGSWTLVEFQPAEELEPMLAALLAAQMNQLVVTFHGGKMTVQGAGLNAERTFTVTTAAADGFAANITDPTNVVYQVNGAFQGQTLGFTSLTDPWRGHGKLQRAR